MTTMWRCAFPRDWRGVRPPSPCPSLSSPNPALSQTFRDSKSSYQPQISCFTFPPKAVQRGPAQRALGRTRDSAPPAPAQAGPELDAVAGWLQQAAGLSATDAYAALQFLSSDGCRCVDDVFLLAQSNALPAEIPTVFRLKIQRAFGL